jgi:hypothetical protein
VLVVAVTAVAKLVTPMAVPRVLMHQKAAIATAAKALARNPREAIPFSIRSFFFIKGEFPNVSL